MTAMGSVALVALLLLLCIPLLMGVFSICIKPFQSSRLMTGVIALSLILLAVLFWAGEQTLALPVNYMGESISLSISLTAVVLFALLLVGLGSLLLFKRGEWRRGMTKFEAALLYFALSFGGLAFFSNQFMIRYIALEGVGLLAAMAVCPGFEQEGFRRFGNVFLTLRIGDIGLLASILLILPVSGTLDISEMITAAAALPLSRRIWVVGGFVLAGVVKMGVFPFAGWQEHAWVEKESPAAWITGFLMPGLGMYLLYRVRPVLASDVVFQIGLPILGAALILAQLVAGLRKGGVRSRFSRLGSALNGFVLLVAALGSGALLRDCFLGLMIYRLIVFMRNRQEKTPKRFLLDGYPVLLVFVILILHWEALPLLIRVALPGLALVVVFWDRHLTSQTALVRPVEVRGVDDSQGLLTRLAEGLYQTLEMGLFSQGVVRLVGLFSRLVNGLHRRFEIGVLSNGLEGTARVFGKATNWLNDHFEMVFERIWAGLGKGLTRASMGWLRQVEDAANEQAEIWMEGVLQSVDEREQEHQLRPLHRDLVWIPILMVVLLIFLYFVRGG